MFRGFLRMPSLHESLAARGLLSRAVFMSGVFLLLHLLGVRAYTSVLCGTTAATGGPAVFLSMLGLLYVFAYIGCVVIAPIFAVSAALQWLWSKVQP